ncbi:MAG: PepSY domain-containing protein [Oscillospiraceae bacterium]
MCYEVEFESGGMAYSYEINAATGAILKHETGLDD